MKQVYHFTTAFRSLKTLLELFLNQKGIEYTVSGKPADWLFTISLSDSEWEMVSNYLGIVTMRESLTIIPAK